MTIQQVLLGGQAFSPTYATWNPADKHANVTLSGGDLTADFAVASLNSAAVRATISKSYGQWYWEIDLVSASDATVRLGIANSSHVLSSALGGTTAQSAAATSVTGVWSILVDVPAATIVVYRNGGAPSAPVSFSSVSGAIFPAVSVSSNNSSVAGSAQIITNFGASAFAYALPAGYAPLY
jgi:hypothetical protein